MENGGGGKSILSEIISNGFIEPELLAELDEDQKQILFCKMREEQLRRWAKYETEEGTSLKPKTGGRRGNVKWKLGTDGEPWVWIMGDHPNDPSIDDIIERESEEKALHLAEKETEELRHRTEEELKAKLRLEVAEAELERLKLNEQMELDNQRRLKEQADADAQFQASVRESRLAAERLEESRRQLESAESSAEPKVSDDVVRRYRRQSEEFIHNELVKRQSLILESMREAREKANREAEVEGAIEDQLWAEQERHAKEAEDKIRQIARRAREKHRLNSLRTSTSFTSAFPADGTSPVEPGKSLTLPRPSKPKSREAILRWFIAEEKPLGTGLDPESKEMATWFHGIISRTEAEELLQNRSIGAFLVRVSERIWGFAVSYRSPEKVCHFLVERIPGGYQFLGTNQIVHKSLWELINYHMTVPVTTKGGELLLEPTGQIRFPPDYTDLWGRI